MEVVVLVAFSTPATGTVASAETDTPSAEAVNAKLIKCACINCPISLSVLAERNLIIERIDKDNNVLAAATYAIPNTGGSDRTLIFDIDVAIFTGAKLRARIDACGPSETQWVVINYGFEAI